jgi:hypothetical protein
MWCFSHEQQTDKVEFEYALAVALRVLAEVSQSEDFFTRCFAECVIDMLQVNKLSGPFEFYLFSVSRHRDHGPQWRSYGRNGTVSRLGFRRRCSSRIRKAPRPDRASAPRSRPERPVRQRRISPVNHHDRAATDF